MASQSILNDTIRSLKTICYFYINEKNASFSLIIIKYLKQLRLQGKLNQEINNLESDWKTIFHSFSINDEDKLFTKEEIYEIEKNTNPNIPNKYLSNDESKLLYITTQVLVNVFKSGQFEIGFQNLMEISCNWTEIYAQVIGILRNNFDISNELGIWLMQHFFVAVDLNNKSTFEFGNYLITIKSL